jgi:hypothetical protein
VGENSNTYLYHKEAPKRIKKQLSKSVKISAMLRNPIERAYSGYCMQLRRGNVDNNIEKYLNPKKKRPNTDFLKQGKYYEHLKRYMQVFDNNKVKVFIYSDLIKDTRQFLKNVYEFIEVEDYYPSDIIDNRVNKKTKKLVYPRLKRWVKDTLLERVARRAMSVAPYMFDIFKTRRVNYPEITPDIRVKLENYYEEDVRKLSRLIDRDLMHWVE